MEFSKRQNKKTLGIENLLGVSVINRKVNNKFKVSFQVEMKYNRNRYYGGCADTSHEAAQLANSMFSEIFGGHRLAKKEGYWNSK